jgi:hypothetical protein
MFVGEGRQSAGEAGERSAPAAVLMDKAGPVDTFHPQTTHARTLHGAIS